MLRSFYRADESLSKVNVKIEIYLFLYIISILKIELIRRLLHAFFFIINYSVYDDEEFGVATQKKFIVMVCLLSGEDE